MTHIGAWKILIFRWKTKISTTDQTKGTKTVNDIVLRPRANLRRPIIAEGEASTAQDLGIVKRNAVYSIQPELWISCLNNSNGR